MSTSIPNVKQASMCELHASAEVKVEPNVKLVMFAQSKLVPHLHKFQTDIVNRKTFSYQL